MSLSGPIGVIIEWGLELFPALSRLRLREGNGDLKCAAHRASVARTDKFQSLDAFRCRS